MITKLILLFTIFIPTIFNTTGLSVFIEKIRDNTINLRGLYAESIVELKIVQSPTNTLSMKADEVLELSISEQLGNTILVAHNTLGGKNFKYLTLGQTIYTIKGNGSYEKSIIIEIAEFESLSNNLYKESSTGLIFTDMQLVERFFFGNKHVLLQTCVEKDYNYGWGRLFIVAIPQEH